MCVVVCDGCVLSGVLWWVGVDGCVMVSVWCGVGDDGCVMMDRLQCSVVPTYHVMMGV